MEKPSEKLELITRYFADFTPAQLQQLSGLEAAYQLAGQTMACNMMDAAAQEGARAFAEKRTPEWKR